MFDIDKLYISLPEFYKKADGTLAKVNTEANTPEELKYSNTKQRNNLIIDLRRAVLTHPETAHKLLNPGGFDNWIKVKDEYQPYVSKAELNILSPVTQMGIHAQNMAAKKLIGGVANHNTNHALLQDTQAELSEDAKFLLNGISFTKLNKVKANEGLEQKYANDYNFYISRNLGSLLASAVDAIKQPVLNVLNINSFTLDSAALLLRLGHKEDMVGALLAHPAIKELTNRYFKLGNKVSSKEALIKDLINDYTAKLKDDTGVKATISDNFYKVELDKDIKDGYTINNIEEAGDARNKTIKNHIKVLEKYSKILAAADDLSKVVSVLRADTANGGAGPTIGDTISKFEKIKEFHTDRDSQNNPKIIGLEKLFSIIEDDKLDYTIYNNDTMRKLFKESELPYSLAFTAFGILGTQALLKKHFPHYSDNFVKMINSFKALTKDNKINVDTRNNIYAEYLNFMASSIDSFGGNKEEGDIEYYVHKFPDYMRRILANPKYKDNAFLSKLQVSKIGDTGLSKVVFNNVGKLSPEMKETVMRGWEDLLDGDESDKRLALALFYYSRQRNGLSFGPETFAHLASVRLKLAVPGYIDFLKGSINKEFDYQAFKIQYLRNHLDNRKFTPLFEDNTDSIPAGDSFKIEVRSKDKQNPYKNIIQGTFMGETVFHDSIGVKDSKGNIRYYYLSDTVSVDGDTSAEYTEWTPLGLKNEFKEYIYDTDSYSFPSKIGRLNTSDEYSEADSYYEGYDDSFTFVDLTVEEVNPMEDELKDDAEFHKTGPLSDKEYKAVDDDTNNELC